jgi:hypothetical protein
MRKNKMSSKKIIAKRDLICDLCGMKIPRSSWCWIIHDDAMPEIVYFEHIQCPSRPAAAKVSNRPDHKKHAHHQSVAAMMA